MRGATRYNILLLSSYLSRIGRIENPSFSACRHPSQDTSHLILHCPATDSLRRSLFGDCLSTTSGPCHGDLPGFWASMVFRHAPIPWTELGSETSNNTSRTSIFLFFVPPLQVALTNFASSRADPSSSDFMIGQSCKAFDFQVLLKSLQTFTRSFFSLPTGGSSCLTLFSLEPSLVLHAFALVTSFGPSAALFHLVCLIIP